MNQKKSKSPINALNESGFPFQFAIKKLLEKNKPKAWYPIASEVKWEHSSLGRTGYIDLIVVKGGESLLYLVIECKKFLGQTYIFQNYNPPFIKTKKYSYLGYAGGEVRKPENAGKIKWFDDSLSDEVNIAEACTGVEKDKIKQLDQIIGDLLLSTECYSRQSSILGQEQFHKDQHGCYRKVLIPMIITTAELKFAVIDSSKTDVSKGTVREPDITDVDWIIYRKTFPSIFPDRIGDDNKSAEELDSRSVIIVRGDKLIDCLTNLDFGYSNLCAMY